MTTYEDFYNSVQAYSSEMLRLVAGIRNSATILQRVTYAMIDEAGYTHIPAIWQHANRIDERSIQVVEQARRTFYPRDMRSLGDPNTFHEMNRLRWQPYDADAWRQIINEFSGVVLPWLRDIEPAIAAQGHLIEQEIDLWIKYGIPDKLRQIKQVNTNLVRNCARVRKALQTQSQRHYYGVRV